MATTPLREELRLTPATHEIRGAALVAHIEARLAAHEAAKRPPVGSSGPDD